jgi:hypothetical protein
MLAEGCRLWTPWRSVSGSRRRARSVILSEAKNLQPPELDRRSASRRIHPSAVLASTLNRHYELLQILRSDQNDRARDRTRPLPLSPEGRGGRGVRS